VNYLVEGSIRQQSEMIAISAQLIDGHTEFQIASYEFTGRAEETIESQIRAALDIADMLHIDLTEEERSAVNNLNTDHPEAHVAFLKGWMLLESLHFDVDPPPVEKLNGAKRHFENALSLDSPYAPAYTGISMVESAYYKFGYYANTLPLQQAEQMAKMSLRLDPDLPEGHLAMGEVYLELDKFAEAISSYQKSLDSNHDNPIAYCHTAYSYLRSDPRDPKSAEQAARQAIKYGATYIWSYIQLAEALRVQEKYDQAAEYYLYCAELDPGWYRPFREIGAILMIQGEADGAINNLLAKERSNLPLLEVRMAFSYNMKGQNSYFEIFDNVGVHANTIEPVITCGQLYPAARTLKFTLVDLGDGFLKKIARFTRGREYTRPVCSLAYPLLPSKPSDRTDRPGQDGWDSDQMAQSHEESQADHP
jgi:tetratricopeptide (TPR) repeat protein